MNYIARNSRQQQRDRIQALVHNIRIQKEKQWKKQQEELEKSKLNALVNQNCKKQCSQDDDDNKPFVISICPHSRRVPNNNSGKKCNAFKPFSDVIKRNNSKDSKARQKSIKPKMKFNRLLQIYRKFNDDRLERLEQLKKKPIAFVIDLDQAQPTPTGIVFKYREAQNKGGMTDIHRIKKLFILSDNEQNKIRLNLKKEKEHKLETPSIVEKIASSKKSEEHTQKQNVFLPIKTIEASKKEPEVSTWPQMSNIEATQPHVEPTPASIVEEKINAPLQLITPPTSVTSADVKTQILCENPFLVAPLKPLTLQSMIHNFQSEPEAPKPPSTLFQKPSFSQTQPHLNYSNPFQPSIQQPIQTPNLFNQPPQLSDSQRLNMFPQQNNGFQTQNTNGIFPNNSQMNLQSYGFTNYPPSTQTYPYSTSNNINNGNIVNPPFSSSSYSNPFGMYNQQPPTSSSYEGPVMFVASDPSIALQCFGKQQPTNSVGLFSDNSQTNVSSRQPRSRGNRQNTSQRIN